MPPRKARSFDGVGEWNAYARRNPLPDGSWWPLKWEQPGARIPALAGSYADISRTHPTVFGVWREQDGTYTVAMKAEALRGVPFKDTREVKRRKVESLLELRTLLITLANNPNTA